MTKLRVAINGFGRIGRAFYKLASYRDDMEVVAVNDLGDQANLMYLLKYDSAYGTWSSFAKAMEDKPINFLQVREIKDLPWKDLNIDVVVECTGLFTDFGQARGHIAAGAKRVV